MAVIEDARRQTYSPFRRQQINRTDLNPYRFEITKLTVAA